MIRYTFLDFVLPAGVFVKLCDITNMVTGSCKRLRVNTM